MHERSLSQHHQTKLDNGVIVSGFAFFARFFLLLIVVQCILARSEVADPTDSSNCTFCGISVEPMSSTSPFYWNRLLVINDTYVEESFKGSIALRPYCDIVPPDWPSECGNSYACFSISESSSGTSGISWTTFMENNSSLDTCDSIPGLSDSFCSHLTSENFTSSVCFVCAPFIQRFAFSQVITAPIQYTHISVTIYATEFCATSDYIDIYILLGILGLLICFIIYRLIRYSRDTGKKISRGTKKNNLFRAGKEEEEVLLMNEEEQEVFSNVTVNDPKLAMLRSLSRALLVASIAAVAISFATTSYLKMFERFPGAKAFHIFLYSCIAGMMDVRTRINFISRLVINVLSLSMIGMIGIPTQFGSLLTFRTYCLFSAIMFQHFAFVVDLFRFEMVLAQSNPISHSQGKAKLAVLLLGWTGIHRFYIGRPYSALGYALSGGLLGFGWIYDIVLVFKNPNLGPTQHLEAPTLEDQGYPLKYKYVYYILWLFLGFPGVHRMYIGGTRNVILCTVLLLTEFLIVFYYFPTLNQELAQMIESTLFAFIWSIIAFVIWLHDGLILKESFVDYEDNWLTLKKLEQNKNPLVKYLGRDSADWIIPYKEIHIEEAIGSGATAIVSRGKWHHIPVAVKKINHPELIGEEVLLAEAKIHSKMNHANILVLYGVCVKPLCFVTEYMENGSLYSVMLLHKKKPFTMEFARLVAIDIASGLQYLHHNNIIHRDLKSLNVLLNSRWTAKIGDFGTARNELITATIQVGTLRWAAPEAITSGHHTTKCDMWSIGVIIWEVFNYAITGSYKVPYSTINQELLILERMRTNQGFLANEDRDVLPHNIRLLVQELTQLEPTARLTPDDLIERMRILEFDLIDV